MGFTIDGVPPFCQAVDCASHAVLQLAMDNNITNNN